MATAPCCGVTGSYVAWLADADDVLGLGGEHIFALSVNVQENYPDSTLWRPYRPLTLSGQFRITDRPF
jgi:hypothetical protein